MNEAEVRQAALRKGVKIYALHLRTPAGKNNHGYAEQQYRSLGAALRRRAKRGEQVGGHRLRHADGIPRSPRPGARAAGRHRLDRRP
ncbi:hypothetical protein [Pseudomonas aeruginosa]|uniref:hypothetical protein n=1 Tax=Pseudomonas aeruginosa TaxID=287 RepID=UPI0004D39A39|nr:hypothetical protein RLJV_23970 [Pseudomonas aeruginosa]